MGKNREVKASFLYLIGNISTKAIAFITIPLFTRLLTPDEYGIVNTYSSWVHIASVLVTLSLYNSFRMAYVEKKDDFESYCASVIRLSGLLFVIGMVAATLLMLVSVDVRNIWWMVYCCLIQAYGTFCVTAMSTKYMLQFNYTRRAVYMIIPNVFCAIFALLLMYLNTENRVFWRIAAYVAVYIAFICIALLETRKGRTKREYWKYAITYSLPLVFHGLSLVVLSSSDRIMITSLVGAAQSGIYSLVYNLGLIATAVATSLEGIWLPWFITKLKNEEIQKINDKVTYLIENITVVVIGVMLVSPEILQIMASKPYWVGKPIIFPIVLASYITFLYDLAVNVEYQYKATKVIATNTMMAALINIALNIVLIPKFGAIAAAYTTVIAYLFSLVFHMIYAKKLVSSIFPVKRYVKYFLVVICACVISEFTLEYVAIRWVIAMMLGVAYLYAMFVKKRFIALQIKMDKS